MTTPGTKPCELFDAPPLEERTQARRQELETSNLRNLTMHLRRALQLCALPMALALLLGPARAQAPEHSTDDAPLDLSTPEPDSGKLKGMTPFAERASALDWNGKAGIDYSKPSIPAVTFQ